MDISKLGVFCRGIMMGLAEIIPGISGGTVAFLTGIYPILIKSIASFGINSFRLILAPKQFFKHHNLSFLLTLIFGMILGVLLFANLIGFLLSQYGPIVWGYVLRLNYWIGFFDWKKKETY